MKKTVNINLNGVVFHIDEDAFALLQSYLESLTGHFHRTEGKDEIMSDIEARIAEMFQEIGQAVYFGVFIGQDEHLGRLQFFQDILDPFPGSAIAKNRTAIPNYLFFHHFLE